MRRGGPTGGPHLCREPAGQPGPEGRMEGRLLRGCCQYRWTGGALPRSLALSEVGGAGRAVNDRRGGKGAGQGDLRVPLIREMLGRWGTVRPAARGEDARRSVRCRRSRLGCAVRTGYTPRLCCLSAPFLKVMGRSGSEPKMLLTGSEPKRSVDLHRCIRLLPGEMD